MFDVFIILLLMYRKHETFAHLSVVFWRCTLERDDDCPESFRCLCRRLLTPGFGHCFVTFSHNYARLAMFCHAKGCFPLMKGLSTSGKDPCSFFSSRYHINGGKIGMCLKIK